MEVTRRRGRRRKKLLDDLKDRRGYSHLKEEALDRTMWRNRFKGGFGPVVRQNTEWTNDIRYDWGWRSAQHVAFIYPFPRITKQIHAAMYSWTERASNPQYLCSNIQTSARLRPCGFCDWYYGFSDWHSLIFVPAWRNLLLEEPRLRFSHRLTVSVKNSHKHN
jgi:hypothetical protein